MKQNITLSIDKELLVKLKIVAAKRSTSVNRLLTDELREIIEKSERYEISKRSALHAIEIGMRLGGKPALRDALHER